MYKMARHIAGMSGLLSLNRYFINNICCGHLFLDTYIDRFRSRIHTQSSR
jgi:hypothetical protein